MMYYSNGQYIYNDPPSRRSKVEKPIEYAFKDPVEYVFKNEVDYLKEIIEKHDVDICHCLQAIEVNRKDCEQMYQAIDITKDDIQNLMSYVDYLHSCIKAAQIDTHRKRRVTIRANGQTVEVCR